MSVEENAKLTLPGGKTYEFPIIQGAVGPNVIDMRSLYKQTGMFSHDPGFLSTSSCRSSITYIDGEAGILKHRGYSIENLVENCDFLDVCHLLLDGEIPNTEQKEKFAELITRNTMVHEQIHFLFRGFPRYSHPMAILVGAFGSLSAFYHESIDINTEEEREIATYKIIAKMPTLVAMAYKYSIGQPFVYPDNSLSFSENFLKMMFAVPCEKYKLNQSFAKAMDKLFILHADHEQNASTSTVRLAGSSGANPFATIGAGISSLWGPSHGGANQAVIEMIEEIGDKSRVPEFIAKAKDKNDPFRLMGFGHRVYKNYDPRAKVIKKFCDEVLEEVGGSNKKLAIARELERIALEDDYFVARKLFPNVDFYSGIIYEAMGIPTSLFTCLFALARCSGWAAQWKEMMDDKEQKIGRPRQLYTGETDRKL